VTIKSHHNVGGLPDRMHMKLVEPLRDLLQGRGARARRELTAAKLCRASPLPRAGSGDPHPGAITAEKLEILRKADVIYLDEIRQAGLYDEIWQGLRRCASGQRPWASWAMTAPMNMSVRSRVTSSDGMTADSYPFEHAFLARVATRIVTRSAASTASSTT